MISISIKDYVGVVYDGLLLSLILNINDKIYNLVYWFSDDDFTLKCDDNFLYDMDISSIEEYQQYEKFVKIIDKNIDKEKLLNDILKNENEKKYYELMYVNNMLSNLDGIIDTL